MSEALKLLTMRLKNVEEAEELGSNLCDHDIL